MTPERVAALVARWVRLYTRSLPASIAERRRDEIQADLHDQVAHERARGTSEHRIALSVAARMLRGLAADVSWRGQALAHAAPKTRTVRRSAMRIALVTALVLSVPLVGMLVSEGVDWSVADFVLAAILLAGSGLLLELAVRRPRSSSLRAVAVAVGIAAVVLGEADDAPGLVGFGGLLVAATAVLAVRAARRTT